MAVLFANNNSLSAITSLPASISGGGMTLISTQTASSSSTISFTSGIDSTYDEYVFKFYDIHPATQSGFTVNFRDGGSDFDATKTTTCFNAQHNEADSSTNLGYERISFRNYRTRSFFNVLSRKCGCRNVWRSVYSRTRIYGIF